MIRDKTVTQSLVGAIEKAIWSNAQDQLLARARFDYCCDNADYAAIDDEKVYFEDVFKSSRLLVLLQWTNIYLFI